MLLHSSCQNESPQKKDNNRIKVGCKYLLRSESGDYNQQERRDKGGDVKRNHLGHPQNYGYSKHCQYRSLEGFQSSADPVNAVGEQQGNQEIDCPFLGTDRVGDPLTVDFWFWNIHLALIVLINVTLQNGIWVIGGGELPGPGKIG